MLTMARLPSHILALAVLTAALAAAPAHGASKLTIRGAGWGHGVGMSQYGAMGAALQGWRYDRILAHYYTDTALGRLNGARTVRVLLQSSRSASFTGASAAAGRRLSPRRTYFAGARTGGRVALVSPRGRTLATVPAPLRATGPGGVVLRGRAGNERTNGRYRGALEFRPGALGGINAVNAVSLDDYVQGVVPLESPASWPIEALKAQAVAARTYAITTSKGGDGFDHYPDTRSQVYGGVSAEVASTNAATQATAGQLVTHAGVPVPTYFFSTSGGRTEDAENTVISDVPRPWLKSVSDPFDSVSPKHRWGPIRLSLGSAGARLGGLVRGRFRGIEVVQRGRSPRIVAAEVIGTGGRVRVDGATLRARFGLNDTWAYFTSISTDVAPAPQPVGDPATGGITPTGRASRWAGRLAGRILPARAGARVRVQRRTGSAWVDAGSARVGRGGRYAAAVVRPGVYRVVHRGAAGPRVRVG